MGFQQGVEKEGLRVLPSLRTSDRSHSQALGHKLTHPYITTDYAENLLEFVTPVFKTREELLRFLGQIQRFALNRMDKDEVIWPVSMPALLPENEDQIPIADFGRSNVGRLKSLYRIGLGHRYGKSMQSIAGVHYNFSLQEEFFVKAHRILGEGKGLQEFKDAMYFRLIRNFRRRSWLLAYLFGASPMVDASFLTNKKHQLQKLGKDTYGKEFATSLRMGGLGYTSAAQASISVCYNKLSTYVKTLEIARKTSYPAYEKIGLKSASNYKQLNTNLLQIDNEFYSTIRPKRTALSKESALKALHRGGLEYIEVRLLDLNPFAKEGIDSEQILFSQLFLLSCLLDESKLISDEECGRIEKNFQVVVNEGRDPHAKILSDEKLLSVQEAATKLMEEISKLMESNAVLKERYEATFNKQMAKIQAVEKLPSAQMIHWADGATSFVDKAYDLAKRHKEELLAMSASPECELKLEELTRNSLAQEKALVEQDRLSFDDFLVRYFKNIEIKEYR